MPRYKLIIEYDGTGFYGWQDQRNGRSVQEAITLHFRAVPGTCHGHAP
jgi:tRNA pseudouridine38-40 synthase